MYSNTLYDVDKIFTRKPRFLYASHENNRLMLKEGAQAATQPPKGTIGSLAEAAPLLERGDHRGRNE